MMLYRSLLLGLADACDAECGSEILALHRLDGKAQLSKEVSHAVHRGVAAVHVVCVLIPGSQECHLEIKGKEELCSVRCAIGAKRMMVARALEFCCAFCCR